MERRTFSLKCLKKISATYKISWPNLLGKQVIGFYGLPTLSGKSRGTEKVNGRWKEMESSLDVEWGKEGEMEEIVWSGKNFLPLILITLESFQEATL